MAVHHRPRQSDHGSGVGLVLGQHVPVNGVGAVKVLVQIKRLGIVEGYALEVLPVVLLGKGVCRPQ